MNSKRVYALCHTDTCCPVVELDEEKVVIGEAGNQVVLKLDEWNALRNGILRGEL